MITLRSGRSAPLQFEFRINGVAAYVDNFALSEFAKPSQADRGHRFIAALTTCNGSLLFSGTNAAELAALRGDSATNMRAFLKAFGARWVMVEPDPTKVIEREAAGKTGAFFCPELMYAFFENRMADMEKTGGITDLSADTFFNLGAVMDWMPHFNATGNSTALDQTVVDAVRNVRLEYEADPSCLDKRFPPIPFDKKRPATFVWMHVLRRLVIDAKGHPLKQGDGRDLCHAVVGAAYGSFAVLDKHWKKRIEELPKPNGLAKIYYAPELDQLVADLEKQARAMSASPQGNARP